MSKLTVVSELICGECEVKYEKPTEYLKLAENPPYKSLKSFYERQIKYCDKCRRKKEIEMLRNGLPKVINALTQTFTQNQQP